MHEKEKLFLKFKGRSHVKSQFRRNFSLHNKSLTKLCAVVGMHKQAFCDDLENMTSENPIELWEKIKKLGARKSNSIPVAAYGENVEVITMKISFSIMRKRKSKNFIIAQDLMNLVQIYSVKRYRSLYSRIGCWTPFTKATVN